MKSLQVYLDGLGVYGSGLSGWSQTAAVLSGEQPYVAAPIQLPPVEALPPAERRRVGVPIKLAFAAGFEALRQAQADAAQLATVFTSSTADGDNCHAILETLASSDRAVSPTRFHNSVHNAPSGYWSIATACQRPSTSLAAYDGSFVAGLLEAATQVQTSGHSCLLLAYDAPYPQPLASVRPLGTPFGLALLLSPSRSATSLARLELALSQRTPTAMPDQALDALRLSVPAARSLPLLQRLARGQAGSDTLEYLNGCTLDVRVEHAA